MLSGHARPSKSASRALGHGVKFSSRLSPSSTPVSATRLIRHQRHDVQHARTAVSAEFGQRNRHLTQSLPGSLGDGSATLHLSDLGVRSARPPDSIPDPDSNPGSNEPPREIGDQEWEIRTGRALYVIQETLPEFFEHGLITSVNKATGVPSRTSSSSSALGFSASQALSINLNNFLELPIGLAPTPEDEEPIYSPNVKLEYTPPGELPPPFPKTFHIEGFQLYVSSSSIIRHTMNALYSDLNVKATKLVIKSPPALPTAEPASVKGKHTKRPINREKSFIVRQVVTGIARVSGKPAEWEIESTYTFSPVTGLIHKHIVNSIQPAPHIGVYDSLRTTLGKILGWAPGSTAGPGGVAGVGCTARGSGRVDGRA